MRDTFMDAFSGSRLFTTARVSLVLFSLMVLPAAPSKAAEVLFPEPFHLTREIRDPITGTTTTVDEYCQGNRISASAGPRTTVVDYERDEILSVDRAAGTYSITSFETAAAAAAVRSPEPSKTQWRIEPLQSADFVGAARRPPDTLVRDPTSDRGVGRPAGRPYGDPPRASIVDRFVATRDATNGLSRIELAFDRDIRISRGALEALLGSSYPSPSSPALEVIVEVIDSSPNLQTKSTGESVRYPLPIEQRMTYAAGGETVEISNRVVRVGRELAPMDLVAIPAGFRRVDDEASTRARVLRELDSLSTPGSTRP